MKLTHFRDLLAIARTGSLRAASRHLGIAQPVITRSIRELERELGQPLLERHTNGVSLTPVGERFVRRIQGIQDEVQRAKDEVAQWSGEFVGEVAVGLSPICTIKLLPTAIAAFTRLYPRVVTKVTQTLFQPIETKLASGLLDFWIGPMPQRHVSQRFAVEQFMPNGRRIAARPNHPLLGARGLEDLVDAAWVRPPLSDRYAESDLEATFEQRGLPAPKVMVESGDMLITLITVSTTDLLTVLPEQMFQLMPVSRFCVPLEHVPVLTSDPICLVTRQGLPLTPLAEKFSDLLRRAAGYDHTPLQ